MSSRLKKLAMIGALLGVNTVLGVSTVRAGDEDPNVRLRCAYQEHPLTGTWGEYCLSTCHFCTCGGSCD